MKAIHDAAMVLFLGLNIATLATANTQLGNGGDAVVCRKTSGEIERVYLLDFYEKTALNRPFDIDLGPPDIDPVEKVRGALQRYKRVDLRRAKYYEKELNNFFSKVSWSNVPLTKIDDEGLTIEPDCPVQQLAIQRNPLVPSDGQYLIQKTLWDNLDNDNRAGLILHEIVYHEALANGHLDSYKSRFLNVAILSKQMSKIELDGYSGFTASINFPQTVVFWKSPKTGTQWAMTTGYSFNRQDHGNFPYPPVSDVSCQSTIQGGVDAFGFEGKPINIFGRVIADKIDSAYDTVGHYSYVSKGNVLQCIAVKRVCYNYNNCEYRDEIDGSHCFGKDRRLCRVSTGLED